MPVLLENWLNNPITLVSIIISVLTIGAGLVFLLLNPRLFLLIVKNLRRNLVRSILTALATMVLVFMVTLIWTVVYFLDQATKEKAKDLKLIVTERWQLPSQMPGTHANYLNPDRSECIIKDYITPNDFMTWSFYGGSIEKGKVTRESIVFFFAMDPKHVIPMMDDLGDLDPALIEKLKSKREACLVGRERLASINKKVGERFKVFSFNYKEVDLEFEVVGELPEGRYNQSAIMNADYFNQALDDYPRTHKGQKHPLDTKRLNLVWLRVKDRPTFEKVGGIIETSEYFNDRPVKVETASSGISSFLDAYADILNDMKWILVPSILITMSLVMANAISISVRERRTEMAVLKVLGYRPNQVLGLILGESLLVGAASGFAAAALAYGLINLVIGGIKFPIAFFPAFFVPVDALFWGVGIGAGTAFLGAFLPAWTARNVKVSEVFSKVA